MGPVGKVQVEHSVCFYSAVSLSCLCWSGLASAREGHPRGKHRAGESESEIGPMNALTKVLMKVYVIVTQFLRSERLCFPNLITSNMTKANVNVKVQVKYLSHVHHVCANAKGNCPQYESESDGIFWGNQKAGQPNACRFIIHAIKGIGWSVSLRSVPGTIRARVPGTSERPELIFCVNPHRTRLERISSGQTGHVHETSGTSPRDC